MKLTLGALIAVTALAGWAQTGPCAEIMLSAQPEPPIRISQKPISATSDENFYVHVIFSNTMTGDHVVNVKLTTPGGFLYQQVDVPITLNTVREPATRSVPGYPRPLTVVQVDQNRSPRPNTGVISIAIPLAGTTITQNALFGKWSVDVDLDFEPKTCTGAVVFEIEP